MARPLVLLLLMVLTPLPALAADDSMMSVTRSVITAQRQDIVEKTLDLDEADALVFWPLFEQYREDMSLVKERQLQLLEEYIAVYDQMTDEQAAVLVQRWLDLQGDALKVRKTWVRRFNRKLPARLVTRFFQLDHRMDIIILAEVAEIVPLLR